MGAMTPWGTHLAALTCAPREVVQIQPKYDGIEETQGILKCHKILSERILLSSFSCFDFLERAAIVLWQPVPV